MARHIDPSRGVLQYSLLHHEQPVPVQQEVLCIIVPRAGHESHLYDSNACCTQSAIGFDAFKANVEFINQHNLQNPMYKVSQSAT